MKNFCILIVLLSIVSHTANSQVGIMGKRFMLKTDIVNGIRRPITNIELETAISRKFTISLSYSITQTPLKGILKGSNFTSWMQRTSSATWNEFLPDYYREDLMAYSYSYEIIDIINNEKSYKPNVDITAKQKLLGFSMNFYGGGAISAPFGKYFQMGFKAGKQVISGTFNAPYLITDAFFGYQTKYVGMKKVVFKDVDVFLLNLYMGAGRNYLLHPRIMLDLSYGASLNVTRPYNDNYSIFSSMVAHKNGANLVAFSNNENSYSVSSKPTNLNIGLYLNLKLGILLF